MSETIEITTEGEIREYIEDTEGKAVSLELGPSMAIWFVDAGGQFCVVTQQGRDMGVSPPQGDETVVTNDGESIELDIVDLDAQPFEIDDVIETIEENAEGF